MLAHKKELEVVRTEICLKQPKLELATYFISFILFFGRAAQLVGSVPLPGTEFKATAVKAWSGKPLGQLATFLELAI